MYTNLLLASILLLSSVCQADDWRTQDKYLFAASSALLVIDWGQTRHISKHPDMFYEKNPILGKQPSTKNVDRYFASAMILNYLAVEFMPVSWRTPYQTGLIGLELYVTSNNKRIGIVVDF